MGVRRYLEKVEEALVNAIREDHTPEETAFSAAFATFVAVLPTFGFGILFFLVLFKFFKRLNKVAVFGTVVVFNPFVQYPLYALSYNLGRLLVRNPPAEQELELALRTRAMEAVRTFMAGNIFFAVGISLFVYFFVLNAARIAKKKDISISETMAEKMEEDNEKTLEFHEHDPEFREIFKKEKEKIEECFQGCEVRHVGSTSVSGLGGKGIIDVLVSIDSWEREEELLEELKSLGFTHVHPRKDGRRFLSRKPDTSCGDVHIHIVLEGSSEEKQILGFKELLENNEEIAEEYEELKKELSEKDIEEYSREKSRWIDEKIEEFLKDSS